jgi:hypothetical protein
LPYHHTCTLHLQPPEQHEAMAKNFKYHYPEYSATKTRPGGICLLGDIVNMFVPT